MLVSRRTGQPAIMIGPMFAHQKKELATYHTFASSLLGLKPSLKAIQCIGTDGKVALSKGFQLALPSSKHILCFLHSRRNIKYKLSELGMGGDYSKEYISEFFGLQTGTHLTRGLVDSNSEEEFQTNLENLQHLWKRREEEARQTSSPQFYDWFKKYQTNNFKTKMLLPLRKSLGLGRGEYTTNDNESVNALIKKKVDYKASELSIFCERMRELVSEQKEDIHKAFVMDSGPYRVSDEFKYLTNTSSSWTKLGKVAREKHFRLLHSCKFEPYAVFLIEDEVQSTSSAAECNEQNLKEFSISLTDCGFSSKAFEGIWKKASEILSKDDTIVNSPGFKNLKICVSYTSPKPHILTMFESGKIICDCKNNETLALCAHSVAVAEKFNVLKKLVDWYKSSSQSVNLWKVSQSSLTTPLHAGAKPNQRKMNSKNKLPVLTTSNHLPATQVPQRQSGIQCFIYPMQSLENNAASGQRFPVYNQTQPTHNTIDIPGNILHCQLLVHLGCNLVCFE